MSFPFEKTTLGRARVELPGPRTEGAVTIEQGLHRRRSVREFREAPLRLEELSQLLWAAQGITHREGFRTAPSAGALFPLEVYVVAGKVHGLPPGLLRYVPSLHVLERLADGDRRLVLTRAALDQAMVAHAPATLALCAFYERVTDRYGQRGIRYVHMEAGHAAQNVYLQALSLQVGTVVLGAFDDDRVRDVLALAPREQPLYLMPVGKV